MLGITNASMTNHERMQAVSEYWRQQRRTGQLKKKQAVYQSQPLGKGCQCDGAGWFITGSPPALTKCNCGIAGPSQDELRLNSELSVMSHKTFDNFFLDRKYQAIPNASVDVQQRMVQIALSKAKKYAQKPSGWLYIHGLPGTGKSHLAAAIANYLAQHRWSIVYRSMPAMIDTIRDQMHAGQVDNTFAQLAAADLLVLDDIGADGQPTEWAEARIFRLINDRVDRPTVFTSNADVNELRYHQRILDRLNASQRCWINASSMRTAQM
jgi:DNA replication protein DnaC